MTKQDFFAKAYPAAIASGHIWPEYAICEAALESAWGESKLARVAQNLFGQKKGKENFPVISIPTKEYLKGRWEVVEAQWPAFPSWEVSFRERMALLRRNPAYAHALESATGEEFVREVSKVWATDPKRADSVLLTYRFNLARIKAVKGESNGV